MGRILMAAALALTLQACVPNAKETNSDPAMTEAEQALLWVEHADAAADAQRAIQAGDYRLLVPAGRGQSVPGLKPEDGARYRTLCGEKILPGTTDVVRGDRHLQLLQAVHRYAETYNAIVVKRCGGS